MSLCKKLRHVEALVNASNFEALKIFLVNKIVNTAQMLDRDFRYFHTTVS